MFSCRASTSSILERSHQSAVVALGPAVGVHNAVSIAVLINQGGADAVHGSVVDIKLGNVGVSLATQGQCSKLFRRCALLCGLVRGGLRELAWLPLPPHIPSPYRGDGDLAGDKILIDKAQHVEHGYSPLVTAP